MEMEEMILVTGIIYLVYENLRLRKIHQQVMWS